MLYIIAYYYSTVLVVSRERVNSLFHLFFSIHLHTMLSLCMSSLASMCNIVHSKEWGLKLFLKKCYAADIL